MGKRSREETDKETREKKKKRSKKEKKQKKEKRKQKDSKREVTKEESHEYAQDVVAASTHFEKLRVQWIISLFPAALKNLQKSIHESLRTMLLKYIPGLDGVLLAFDNVQIGGKQPRANLGFILNEQPQIHYLVEVDLLIFQPTIGERVSFISACYCCNRFFSRGSCSAYS